MALKFKPFDPLGASYSSETDPEHVKFPNPTLLVSKCIFSSFQTGLAEPNVSFSKPMTLSAPREQLDRLIGKPERLLYFFRQKLSISRCFPLLVGTPGFMTQGKAGHRGFLFLCLSDLFTPTSLEPTEKQESKIKQKNIKQVRAS